MAPGDRAGRAPEAPPLRPKEKALLGEFRYEVENRSDTQWAVKRVGPRLAEDNPEENYVQYIGVWNSPGIATYICGILNSYKSKQV